MQAMFNFRWFLTLTLFLTQLSIADTDDVNTGEYVKLFNQAATKHKGEFESLMGIRGITTNDKVAAATFNTIRDKLSRYKQPTTLLFFYDHDGEKLKEVHSILGKSKSWLELCFTNANMTVSNFLILS